MSTAAGHSAAHALQPRHSSSASCRPSSARPVLQAPLECRPQQHRATARGVALVAEGLEAGAHRALVRPAGAVAVARLRRAGDARARARTTRSSATPGRCGACMIRSPASSGVRPDEHAGVQQPVRVERILEGGEGRDRGRRVHPRQQLAADADRRRARPRATRRGRRRGPRRPRRCAAAGGPRRADAGPSAGGYAGSRRWRARTRPPAGPPRRAGARTSRAKRGHLGGRHRGILDERQRRRVGARGVPRPRCRRRAARGRSRPGAPPRPPPVRRGRAPPAHRTAPPPRRGPRPRHRCTRRPAAPQRRGRSRSAQR